MLLGIAIVLIVIIGIFVTNVPWKQRVVLKVLCAGSLTLPFEEIKAKFEADHESFTRTVEVQLEPGGSVGRVQAVTEIGEECDVLASADYTLIPNMMIPEYTDWYIVHAENSMSLAYTSNSKYADEFNADNWYQILRRSDVKWGFSNPNLDPCGYRSPMVIQLAELEYGDDMIFEDLIEANSDITVSESDGIYMIDTNMSDLNPNTSRLTIRDKSVDLVALVQSGGLDYAFEYSSVSKQHGLRYIDLPESIDLSSDGYRDLYSKVKVRKTTTVSTGKPIVYGVTIPDNAPNKELSEEWIKYMINEYGQGVFTDNGQRPIAPALVNDINKVPESLRSYVTEIE
jgi:molybdate/tungstate transport system substrate-binding protein